MKGKPNLSDQEKTRLVFKQLDTCVDAARNSNQSGDWSEAWQEANKLQSLTQCSYMVQIATNSTAVVSGLLQKNWVMVAVSAAAIFGFAVALYASRRKK